MRAAIVKHGLVGTIAAPVLFLATYLEADAASRPLIVIRPGSENPGAVPLGGSLGFTALGGAVGIGLALIVNRPGRSRTTFVAAAPAGLALYGIMPFAAAERVSTAVWLNVMHLPAALAIVGRLARSPTGPSASAASATESLGATR